MAHPDRAGGPASAMTGTLGTDAPLSLAPVPPGEPAFDDQRPPAAALVADCVHCGFCLPTCPTYALWGEEMDSPRGRIHLMKLAAEGNANLTDSFVQHFDRCLGCMACMTACPSGVRYDRLIEAARAWTDDPGHAPPVPAASAGQHPGAAAAGHGAGTR